MNFYFVLLVCIAAVSGQRGAPPSSPSGVTSSLGPRPSAMPAVDPTMKESPVVTIPASGAAPTSAVSKPIPKGCSPGCGPKDICAELGMSYCRPGQSCSVCIKMSSIRFPASAVYSMFQPKPAPQPQPQPTQYQAYQSQVPAQQTTDIFYPQYSSSRYPNSARRNQIGAYSYTPPIQQTPQPSNQFSYSQPSQQAQQPSNQFDLFGTRSQQQNQYSNYYNTQPVNNNLDMFGFPIQQQQQSNSFNSMFPFLWMDGFGMGF